MEVYLGKIYTPIVFGDAAPSVPSFIGSKVIFWWKSCVRSAGHISWCISFKFCTGGHFIKRFVSVFTDNCYKLWLRANLSVKNTDKTLDEMPPRCASSSNLHTYSVWWCCPQCSVFYRVKGHSLVHILVCTLTAAFLDGFLSNFVWRCILVKIYTPIVFGDAAPSVLSFRVKGHILVEILCALCRPHFLTDFFQILYRCAP